MPKKQANYDEKTVEKMVAVYTAADSDETRAAALDEIQKFTGKSLPSIRSKLGQLGVYVSPNKGGKKGGKRVTKADKVAAISAAYPEKDPDSLECLTSLTNPVLDWVMDLAGVEQPTADNGDSE